MKVPKLNRRLLLRVKAHILAQPKRLDMDGFKSVLPPEDGGPECGTQACIGGWAVLLGNRVPKRKMATFSLMYGSWSDVAQRLLGLTNAEAEMMFYSWRQHAGRKGAKEAAKKIDLILKDRETFVAKTQELING